MGDGNSSNTQKRRVCFSFAAYAKNVIDHLSRCQVPIARGLTDVEFERIENNFGFSFPPDLRSILQEGLPVGVGFPNWRSGAPQQLKMLLDLPLAGLCNEVSKGRFWWKDWGSQPSDTEQALKVAKTYFAKAPLMVPIYSHCYIPCSPNLAGNPVFFVYKKDIFYCGYDVADFFEREAFIPHNFKSTIDQEFDSDRAARRRELIQEPDMKSNQVNNKSNAAMAEKWEEFKRRPEFSVRNSLPKISTRKKEVPGRKSVSEERVIERPEPLIRSAGNSPRAGQARIISRYKYFHDAPLSNNVLNKFTIRAPAWVAKAARRIDFWSDLVENKASMNVAPPEGLFSSTKVDVEIAKSTEKKDSASQKNNVSKIWLKGYLGDIGSRLRSAGWKEDEISDMINPPASYIQLFKGSERQNFMESLAYHVDLLSVSLRKAGWSAKDIFESLDFHSKQRKLPPHLAAKIGQIAEYLAKA
ncbi:hypothetical protein SUGI_0602200 [Cryptomeria japonica]|uniref:uncharacterized protein LOC131071806 n=1 Tax=Cryptomeria japonica TaxID=3369 RepID=UPI0024148D01|nr:uncharacterized protein LOC131071806 [Cryptomeria japonica]GLJ30425.1 hypothetical protein SUGI_0602200 [Cryptomeria japonica]